MDTRFKVDQDDLDELRRMPSCAEKQLIMLMSEFSRTNDTTSLLDEAKILKERIDKEGLNSYEIDEKYKEVKASLSRRTDLALAFEGLKEIHNLIR